MTPESAVKLLEEHMPFNVLVEHYYEAWQTLKSAVLSQPAHNSRYATALEKLLCDWFFESGLDLDDVSDKMKTELIQRLNALRAAHSA